MQKNNKVRDKFQSVTMCWPSGDSFDTKYTGTVSGTITEKKYYRRIPTVALSDYNSRARDTFGLQIHLVLAFVFYLLFLSGSPTQWD